MENKKSRTSGFSLSNQEFMILTSLIGGPKHGYAIAKDVKQITEDRINLSAATLYQNISKLLDSGLIEREAEKEIIKGERRKLYRISGAGERVLREQWKIITKIGKMIPRPAYSHSI